VNDARVVDNERVSRTKVIRQGADDPIFEKPAAKRDEHAGAVAGIGGPKSDAILREVEVEEINAHTELAKTISSVRSSQNGQRRRLPINRRRCERLLV
jgi:hypothetical protein